jgi:hypothetical protein
MASAPKIKIAIQISPLIRKNRNPATPTRFIHTLNLLLPLWETGHSRGLSLLSSRVFIQKYMGQRNKLLFSITANKCRTFDIILINILLWQKV